MTDSPSFLAPVTISDYRELARRRLPRQLFDYLDGGAYDELTLKENVKAFRNARLRQRVMVDVSKIDTSTELFGQKMAMPLILAPVGLAGMMRKRAEVQAAKAAEAHNLPFTLSTVGICPMEEIRAHTKAPFWFQLYLMKDRGFAKSVLDRAKEAGVPVLVFTVDLAVVGARYRDPRNGMMVADLPLHKKLWAGLQYPLHTRWLFDVALGGRPLSFGNLKGALDGGAGLAEFRQWIDSQFDPTVTWRSLEWVRQNWSGPIVLKGILDPEDARAAVSSIGADGIVVSNHGGRQLDGVEPTLHALPRIRDAVGGRTKILVDGGIRNGLDVVKAVASGADAGLIGRAWVFPVAARGQKGVEAVLTNFKKEMKVAMALTGVTRVSDIDRGCLLSK
ncbi:MAG TPA: L-lactate dehydrogenase [Alphaproteobacteria bacterium]|nr:L-lactate dehydrogenase [Alphaproteobacteria bacterium]